MLRLIGSYTSVVGLPLAETAGAAGGEGYAAHRAWAPGGMSHADEIRTSASVPRAIREGQAEMRDLRHAARPRTTIRSAPSAAPTSTCIAGSRASYVIPGAEAPPDEDEN